MSVVGLNTTNPVQSWLVNKVQSALPQNMWSGTPIRNLLQVPVAHAETLGASSQPTPPPAGNGSDITSFFGGMNNLLNAVNQPTGGGGGGTGNIPSGATPPSGPSGADLINSAQQNGNDQLNQDYEQTMGSLANQESGLQGQAGIANAQITNDAAGVQTTLGQQQDTGLQTANAALNTGEQGYKTGMQQARDLFNQTQQSNNSQLSALGISSSSVTAALAEKLGVETARRIAGQTDTIQGIRQNAVAEIGRVKQYYADKSTQLAENVRIQKDQIQQSLMTGLNQINTARQQAANVKSQQRASLLQQVQTALSTLATQQQQWQQQLDTWAQNKSAVLTPLTQDQFNAQMQTQLAAQQKLYPSTQFNTVPTTTMDKNGNMTGSFTTTAKKLDPTDPNYDPFAN